MASINELDRLNPRYFEQRADDLKKLQNFLRVASVASLVYTIVSLACFQAYNFIPLCAGITVFGISERILPFLIERALNMASAILGRRTPLPQVARVGHINITHNTDTGDWIQPFQREGVYLNVKSETVIKRELYDASLALRFFTSIFSKPPKQNPFPTPFARCGAPDGVNVHLNCLWDSHASRLLQYRPSRNAPPLQILIDPVLQKGLPNTHGVTLFSACTPHGAATSLNVQDLVDQITPDIVLITHNHDDHLDTQALTMMRRKNPELVVLAPQGTGRRLRENYGFNQTAYDHRWGESTLIENDFYRVCFNFVPADHSSAATDLATGADVGYQIELWGSWLIQFEEKGWGGKTYSMYFMGDTACHIDDATMPEEQAHDRRWLSQIQDFIATSGHGLDAIVVPIDPPVEEDNDHMPVSVAAHVVREFFPNVKEIHLNHYGTFLWGVTTPKNPLLPLQLWNQELTKPKNESLRAKVRAYKAGDQVVLY